MDNGGLPGSLVVILVTIVLLVFSFAGMVTLLILRG